MTSFGPDFSKLYPATSTTPNPGIHNQDGPTGTSVGGSLPATPEQMKKSSRNLAGGFLRDVAVAVGKVVSSVGDLFENAFEALSDWAFDVDVTLTEHTEAIARLDDIAAAANTTVAYVGDLQDMVTIGRGQLVCVGVEGAKGQNVLSEVDVGTRTSGGDVTALNDLWVRSMPYVRPGASGNIYYVPIVTDRHGVPDKIRWIGGTDNSIFSGTYYEVALCGYNPTTGNLEKVWGSGNIKDTYANTSTLAEIQIDMGLDEEDVAQHIKPGQLLFWCHQQYANGFGQSARSIAAAPQANVARPSGLLLDAACYVAPDFSQGIPSSISFASLTRENRFIPWGAVSVKSIPVEAP
ncbi:MAG: hypothetical protein U5N53_28215 [Mycobacterium sp.]|nr:hypothetical protein [Mycobacterium sp.]